jgi:hypothetical protein
MGLSNLIHSTFYNKCPRCHTGQVFENNNPYSFKNGLKMNTHCPHCNLKFQREVGYFYGSMYVSYGLQTAFITLLFILNTFWWNFQSLTIVLLMIGGILFLFPVTFRWSRIIWIASFTKYEDTFSKPKKGQADL